MEPKARRRVEMAHRDVEKSLRNLSLHSEVFGLPEVVGHLENAQESLALILRQGSFGPPRHGVLK